MYNEFKSKLHLICSSDGLRPALQHIYFKDGYSFCTDAHILVKQRLSIHGFLSEEIEFANGNHIHKDVFKALHNHKKIKIVEEGFEVEIEKSTILYRFSTMEVKPPNYESAIPKEAEKVSSISFNLKFMNKIQKVFILEANGGVVLDFYGSNKGTIITANGGKKEDQMAIIMPIMIEGPI